MEDWKEYILENIVDKFIDYRGKTPKKSENGIPLVTAKIIKRGRILTPNEFISEKDYKLWMTRGFPEINDVVLTTEAPLGEVALIKDSNIALAQRVITLRTNNKICNSIFLKYFLQDRRGQHLLKSRASGSTVSGIKSAVLKKIPITIPPLPEQRAIASVLSSLDNKIDLLHRQNQTLEEMAETLFRQWFDGVNLESTLKDVIDIQSGYAFKSKSFIDYGEERVLKIKNISDKVVDVENSDFINFNDVKSLDDKFLIKEGDILFAMTGAKIGKMGIVPKSDDNLWLNQRVALFREKYYGSKYLAHLHLKSEYGLDYIENTATGSAQPNISASGIENCEFPKLSERKLTEYSVQLAVFYKKVIFNLKQIQTLTQLRDTLLPKLMSGEIRVKK